MLEAMRMQIFGHRGSRATHPDNTIAAFLHAMACGADGVELDVLTAPDGRLVVTHDPVFTSPLPTLDEVLRLDAPRDFWFDIEAKSVPALTPEPARFAAILSDVIGRSSVGKRIVVRSFDHHILRAFHEIEPE